MSPPNEAIAERVARHLRSGEIVNLGIGIPTLVADFVEDSSIFVHTENGLLGVGPSPAPGEEDSDLINAGKLPVTQQPGAAFFSSSAAFGMIRGGHVDVAVLGALEVDGSGRIANWSIPGEAVLGVGGAMDLMAGARRVIVATRHLNKYGEPKIVKRCRYPLTSHRSADLVVTDRATFCVVDGQLVLDELAPDTTSEWLAANTAAAYRFPRAHA
jgi:3-oxoacid CoA-transferase B subunit